MSNKKTVLAFILIGSMFLSGCIFGDSENEKIESEDVEELIEEIDVDYEVRGSCNMIATDSHCLDYIGSFWTTEQMTLNCQGVGTFSENTCPYSDNGGCQTGAGTLVEAVIWSYDYGGKPILAEDKPYEAAACDANPMGQWIMPEALLK